MKRSRVLLAEIHKFFGSSSDSPSASGNPSRLVIPAPLQGGGGDGGGGGAGLKMTTLDELHRVVSVKKGFPAAASCNYDNLNKGPVSMR
jgi:hypothetical protein